jgi:hypothetical protein
VSERRVWFLNFDAEEELARPGAITPSRAMRARCEALVGRVEGLWRAGDRVVIPGDAPTRAEGAWRGMAWCPTPGAVRALRALGASVGEVPAWSVLRAVNHRAFSAKIGQWLPGAAYVRDESELCAVLVQRSHTGVWLFKKPLGYSGRGRLRMRGDEPDAHSWRWLRAALAEGEGLQVEPAVERVEDYGQHAYLARDGGVVWGALTTQRCDANGQWVETVRAREDALDADARRELGAVGERVAAALAAAGYWGPFGIDAFTWCEGNGALRFNALCEVNARYSMGWALGMGDRRPDLG